MTFSGVLDRLIWKNRKYVPLSVSHWNEGGKQTGTRDIRHLVIAWFLNSPQVVEKCGLYLNVSVGV